MAALTSFGASVNSYTANLGWNAQPSQFTVRVAEDLKNGDSYTFPQPGSIYYFSHGALNFGGHVQAPVRKNDFGGNPIYEIVVIDPRNVLQAVQLILNDYNGATTAVPNLWNVFGYWENQGFGYSHVNDTGMPLYLITSAVAYFNSLVLNDVNGYGGPIRFMGNIYRVDLSALPGVTNDYRISSPTVSLLDLILEVCNESGHDAFFELISRPTGDWITLRTVSRVFQPDLTRIRAFIGNSEGAESTEVGLELRDEVTSSFLVGGNKISLFQQVDNETPGLAATIWQYWGLNSAGNAIIGEGTNDDHIFTVDARSLQVLGIGDSYTMKVAELRASLAGQDEWETYICSIRPDIATKVNINSKFDSAKISELISSDITPKELILTARKKAIDIQRGINNHEENIARLYEFVRSYATDFYAKRFMVRIPYTFATIEDGTDRVILSQEPADAAFVEEGAEPLGLSVIGEDRFRVQDGRLSGFVRFENYLQYDLSQMDPEDYWVEGDRLYIGCTVEPDIVYADVTTQYSPRAVIVLNSPLYYNREFTDNVFSPYFGLFEYIIRATLGGTLTDVQIAQLNKNLNVPGGLNLFGGFDKVPVSPNMAAVPLKSNIECYGPWYALGAIGKTQFEKNESLVPWNYGDYDTMNLVANALVQNNLSNMQISELGSVSVPGAPTVGLGEVLIAGGPYVTNLDVSADAQGGIKTSYSMRTFTPKYNPFVKSSIDTVTKMGRRNQQVRRAMREALTLPPPGAKFYKARENAFLAGNARVNRLTAKSPHEMILGKVIDDKINIVTGSVEQSLADLSAFDDEQYISTAGVELGSLFCPYTTSHLSSGNLPQFMSPSGVSGQVTSVHLNPFGSGHNIDLVTRGGTFPSDLALSKDTIPSGGYTDYRGLGLSSPVVLVGWGKDINGNDAGSRGNIGSYKAGPLDARWDNDRGVWTANGGGGLVRAITREFIGPSASGLGVLASTSGLIAIQNWVGIPICEGQNVFLSQEGNSYYVVTSQYNALQVMTDFHCVSGDTATFCQRTIYLPSAYTGETCSGV